MKKIFKTTFFAAIAILCMTACGNANAQSSVVELTNESFETLVYKINEDGLKYLGDKPAIVDFNATWCGPCQRISPILYELAKEYKGKIVIYKVDVDQCPEIASTFNVRTIPAILYIPMGDKEPVMTIGARDKARFKEEIEKILLSK